MPTYNGEIGKSAGRKRVLIVNCSFEKPVLRVFRDTMPFLLILLLVVLLITYVPALTTGVAAALEEP